MRRREQIEQIANDCIYFKSDRPCIPHKRKGEMCRCPAYSPRRSKQLIIQLSSAAGVIRSTALIGRLRMEYPNCQLMYLTSFPELLGSLVDEPLRYDTGSVLRCQTDQFDILYNLDTNKRACAITNMISAEQKKGFYLRGGQCTPIDEDSEGSYLRTVMPRASGTGPRNPLQELFGICGLEYKGERSQLTVPQESEDLWPGDEGVVVGINTMIEDYGLAKSYWEPGRWVKLIEMLEQKGLRSVLLGDAQSDFFNRRIAQESDVEYSGPMEWKDIISGVNQCDVVVSTAGTVMEMAVALGREAVLLQDKRDSGTDVSYLRGRGSIVEPFKLSGDKGTLSELLPDKVVESVLSRIDHLTSRSELHTVVESSRSDPADMSIVRSRVAAGRRKPKKK